MAKRQDDLFKRLTSLFRSGPNIKRKVKAFRTPTTSTASEVFKKSYSQVYSNALNAYGQYDRMSRYADFSEMEYTPEISSAIDIHAEESTSVDDKGQVLHIYSENDKIKMLLDELFQDTLNISNNLTPWVRNLCKYGDFFLFNDVHPEMGVINAFPMPVNEVERDEGWDPNDPLAVRFRWVTQGNQILEAWQVSHFRLMGNDAFLPYGSSILEAARRIWRQLILIEDAMLVYRVVRSPERRVFYIDVGTVPTEEIPNYMEAAQSKLKRAQVIDKSTGRVDLRYNPLSVDEDYFIPVRGSETGTKIDTLAGGQHVSDIADVEYIQKKLFAALKVPRAYLGYDESLSSKATLAQEDIRFSRSISRIQRVLISELEKLAIIHLYAHGYEGEDLTDFSLFLSNPSTVAQQQKLELWRTKFEIAGSAPEGFVDRDFIRKEIFQLSDDQIDSIIDGRREDRRIDLELEAEELEGGGLPGGGAGGAGMGGAPAEELPGEEEAGEEPGAAPEAGEEAGEEAPAGGGEEDLFAGDTDGKELLVGSDEDDEGKGVSLSQALSDLDDADELRLTKKRKGKGGKSPVKSTGTLKRYLYNKGRERTHGPTKTHMPDFASIVQPDDDPFQKKFFRGSPFKTEAVTLGDVMFDSNILVGSPHRSRISTGMKTMLASLGRHIDSSRTRARQSVEILTEDAQSAVDILVGERDPEVDVMIEEDLELGISDTDIEYDMTLKAEEESDL